jgi:hypothetical protein
MISYYADLAIGLVLAFLLLSLMVSGVNEGIVRLFGIRSKFLWAYLRDTLDGAEVAVSAIAAPLSGLNRFLGKLKGFGRRLCRPLIDLLPPPAEGRSRLPATILGVFLKLPFGKDPRPPFAPQPAPVVSPPLAPASDSQVADEVSAEVLADAEAEARTMDATGGTADPAHQAEQADPEEAPQPMAPAGHGKTMTELLHERLQEIDHSKRGKTSIAEIPPGRFAVAVMEIATDRGGIDNMLNDLDRLQSPVYRPLKAVWDKVDRNVEAFGKGVEDWFNGEMERLTLLYRRYVRWVVAALSLVVTLGFNMDTLEYSKTLLNDSAYRSTVTAFGGQTGTDALAPITEQCADSQETYACVTDVLSTPAFVQIFSHAPVSVVVDTTAGEDASPAWSLNLAEWWDRVTTPGHWPGFLVTLVALLFGAPFWWDILRRITGVRSRLPNIK